MSIHLIRYVMFDLAQRDPRMPDGQFRLWQYIAWDVNHAGARTFIDTKRLSENARFPHDTVTRYLRWFERENLLELTRDGDRIVHWIVRRDGRYVAVEKGVQKLLDFCGKAAESSILHPGVPDAGSGLPDAGSGDRGVTPSDVGGWTSVPSLIRSLDPSLRVPVSEERRSASPSPDPNLHFQNAESRKPVPVPLSPPVTNSPPPPPQPPPTLDEVRGRAVFASLKQRLLSTPVPQRLPRRARLEQRSKP